MSEQPGVVYLDSNVFIDAIEGVELLSSPARKMIELAGAGRRRLVTSELTLAEVLAPGKRGRRSADTKRSYLELIVWSRTVDLKPVTREVLMETTKLREVARLKLIDAIHLATAILSGCRFLVSRDEDFREVPAGMERLSASDLSFSRLAEFLR